MKNQISRRSFLAAAAVSAAALAVSGCDAKKSKKEVTDITVWNYYNGDQLECFNKLVEEFNATVGKEQNITVTSESQGSVNDLETNVLAAAEGKPLVQYTYHGAALACLNIARRLCGQRVPLMKLERR